MNEQITEQEPILEPKETLVKQSEESPNSIPEYKSEELSAAEFYQAQSSTPLVERSILFDFTMMGSTHFVESEDHHEETSLNSHLDSSFISEDVSDVVGLDHEKVIDKDTDSVALKDKSSFELEEHLKMLCDVELIEQIQEIPKRISFKIGEVADLVGVKSFVLRFWETEFDLLKPKKASNNQRMYSKKDVEVSFLIKKLLYRDRFSIEGARNVIKQARNQLKNEVSKIEEVTTTKQKMETLVKLQKEKIALLKNKAAEATSLKLEPVADPLTIKSICENVDQISARIVKLKTLFN